MIMPGATRSTFMWTALYLMGQAGIPVDVGRAFQLMQYFGGKAKDGQYHVIKRWALDFGLGTPYKRRSLPIRRSEGRIFQVEGFRGFQQSSRKPGTPRQISNDDVVPGVQDWYMMGEAARTTSAASNRLDQLVDKLQKKGDRGGASSIPD